MLLASFAAVVAVLIYLPSFWVRRVMRLYGGDSVDIPGTGAELARHLIDRFQLDGVAVEECAPFKDHFDPRGPAVRLSPQNYQGRSLAAVAVAPMKWVMRFNSVDRNRSFGCEANICRWLRL